VSDDVAARPETPDVLRDRARKSAEEFQKIAAAVSIGALGVFFISVTQKVDPPLTLAERWLLLAGVAAMAIAALTAFFGWMADARWNHALARAKEAVATSAKSEDAFNQARRWRRWEVVSGRVYMLAFLVGVLASAAYIWLRASPLELVHKPSMKDFLNRAGLLFGIVGVALIFVWGPPQPNLEEGIGIGAEGPLVDEHDAKIRHLRTRHSVLSRIGLALIALGFGAQFSATFY